MAEKRGQTKMEWLRAAREAKAAVLERGVAMALRRQLVTKPTPKAETKPRRRVTKALAAVAQRPDAKANGRPRIHASGAEKQAAYRARLKEAKA